MLKSLLTLAPDALPLALSRRSQPALETFVEDDQVTHPPSIPTLANNPNG